MVRDRLARLAQDLFTFQFLPVLTSIQFPALLAHLRLDRDGGIAYLATITCSEPLGERILRSSAPFSRGKLMVEHEQPAPIQDNRHHRFSGTGRHREARTGP